MQKWIAPTGDHEQYCETKNEEVKTGSGVGPMGKITRKISGLRFKGEVYYADTTANGIRICERIGRVSEQKAKAILSKLISDAFEGKHFTKKTNTGLTVKSVCTEYCTKKLEYVKSKATRLYLFIPLDRLLGNRIVKDLRISDVEEYRRTRLSEKKKVNGKEIDKLISISTVNHEVKELLIALQWAVKERLIEYNPIAGIDHLKEPAPAKVMLDKGKEWGAEWIKLYNAIGERERYHGALTIRGKKDRLRFLIQYKTGMRIGEVNAIQHSWVDSFTMNIRLLADATKAQKTRTIPIDLETIQAIADYRADCVGKNWANDTYLFYNPRTKTHDKTSYHAFNNAVERAGLSGSGITSHALRRTRGTIWDGIDERASMEVLGHSDTKVHRKHYTEVTEDRVRALITDPANIPPTKSKLSQNN